jgi:alanyl-tRNA synthetase
VSRRAQSTDALPDRIRSIQDELRETRRRLRAGAGGGLPKPGELAAAAQDVTPDLRLVTYAGPYESIDALKAAAKDLRGILGSGVIALGLDADEPQLFVSVSDDLVAPGVSAGDLVREAVAAIDGRGGGRPEMAQARGSRREGLSDALATIAAAVRSRVGPEA